MCQLDRGEQTFLNCPTCLCQLLADRLKMLIYVKLLNKLFGEKIFTLSSVTFMTFHSSNNIAPTHDVVCDSSRVYILNVREVFARRL